MSALAQDWVPIVEVTIQEIHSFDWRFIGAPDWMPASLEHEWNSADMAVLDACRCEIKFHRAGYPIETKMTKRLRAIV